MQTTDNSVPEQAAEENRDNEMKEKGQRGFGNQKKQRIKRSKFRRFTPHVLVAIIVYTTLRAVFNSVDGWPTPVQWHVIFGVIGYQVLIGHGTLIIHTMAHKDVHFFPNVSKKTLHWITQALGGVCVLAGTAIIYQHKENHFNSIHGILGLLSLILTAMSTANGVVFYYWQELGIGKGRIKFVHTLTGALTFVLSTVCLMYGYNKKTFFKWSSGSVAYSLMALCAVSIVYFSLSPGRIILNRLLSRDQDAPKDGKGQKGAVEEKQNEMENVKMD